MAITNSQQARQMYNQGGYADMGIMAPRQNYGLGKLVKKAFRGVKKIAKSPLGKAALIGGGAYLLGGSSFMGGGGLGGGFKNFGNLLSNTKGRGLGQIFGGKGKFSKVGNLFRQSLKGEDGKYSTEGNPFSIGKLGLGALAAGSIALPFMGGGGGDEDDGPVDQMDVAGTTNRARNFYSGLGNSGVGLDFMPQKKYVDQNFYTQNAADGGRIGYAGGGSLDEDEEDYVRSAAGQSRRQPTAFLNMGGGAGEAQAEQMLMAEFVKYKNKGGDLSFQEFVQAVMQQQEQSQGMEQPTMMAADGGRIGYNDGGPTFGFSPNDLLLLEKFKYDPKEVSTYKDGGQELIASLKTVGFADGGMAGTSVPGYGTPAGTNQFGYPSGGTRVNAAEGGIMDAEASEMIDMGGNEKDYRETGGFVEMGGEERADDVPARLSKNEFVFTADAVRNAGGGDIDRGSEVMQNMMDNLEQGGQISEGSQGMGGEEEMVSEEIIEEPNGAQAMYEQQQALQSRIA